MSLLSGSSFIDGAAAKRTSVFGLRLYVVVGAVAAAAAVLFISLLSVCLVFRRHRRRRRAKIHYDEHRRHYQQEPPPAATQLRDLSPVAKDVPEVESIEPESARIDIEEAEEEKAENKRGKRVTVGLPPPPPSDLGWGQWFRLRELEEATVGFAEENVIGAGGYGVVYRGVLADDTVVAIKNLLNNKGQGEREFKVEVEAIGRVRHKHLVRMLGYCIEDGNRMLVYEYVNNSNLDWWLHRVGGEVSKLTWEIRMNIILGIAKGLAYLHEGLEPKVVHRDVKASNILLDRQWNPKISDFGLAKHLGSENTHVSTRVMGTFGYVAPEYAKTGKLTERSDVYSFGMLMMEMISGRTPVDYRRLPGEVNLIEWLKAKVTDRKAEEVVDPKMPAKPSPKALKRALLLALHCADPDSLKRPKMGSVIHMLEMDDLLFSNDGRLGKQPSSSHRSYSKATPCLDR